MRTMARTEPAAKVARFANWHTAQMCTHAHHDEPFGFLDAVGIGLRVTEFRYVDGFGVFDFVGGAVADEDGFASPFDEDLCRGHNVSDLLCQWKMVRRWWRTFLPSGIVDRSSSTLA